VQAATFSCTAGDVHCLITAINKANANGRLHNTIALEAGTYTLTNIDNDTDGPNGLPSITSNLTISGAGAFATEITRTPAGLNFLFFRLILVSAIGKLTLQGLTLSGGFSSDMLGHVSDVCKTRHVIPRGLARRFDGLIQSMKGSQ